MKLSAQVGYTAGYCSPPACRSQSPHTLSKTMPPPDAIAPYADTLDVGAYRGYLPTSMRAALEASSIAYLEGVGGYIIPIRLFGQNQDRTPVVMLHGLESHSVWFVQSAQAMAEQGHPVYLLDRRGSGVSDQRRGDGDDFQAMVDEILTVINYVRQRHSVERIHLLGHCFGAIPAAIFAIQQPTRLTSLVLATPGIYTHTDLSIDQKLRILWSKLARKNPYIPSPLESAMFTNDREYLEFVQDDPLALKQVSANFYFEINRARQYIHRRRDALATPTYMLFAGQDVITDNQRGLKFLERIPAEPKSYVVFPEAKHILEFSPAKAAFFDHLIGWLARFEAGA